MGTSQDCCCQCLCACGEPLLTHTSTGDPPTLPDRSGSVSCGVTALFPRVLVYARFCLCTPKAESLSPPVLWKSCNQIILAFKVIPWGFLVLLLGPQAGKPNNTSQNLHNSGRTSLLSFSRLWVTHPASMGFYFIMIAPLLPSCGSLDAQFSSVAQSCPSLCDPMDCSMPGFLVHHQLLKPAQTHVHQVSDAIQPSPPPSSPSPPAFNPSQHQGLFQTVRSSHHVAKVLEFQFQH